ncbi:MarR family winged helix-turn-helix transcriptional regulator [Mycolicibacterium komossense]|nr:MarR family winged helix-turn-helix transcriptional regulator [Mycolicibacterium komossense]
MTAEGQWLNASQQRAWLNYLQVYHRLEYEMNRHLQTECGLSLSDYTVMNALSSASEHRMQLTHLATMIGWERSRLSHHLQRMTARRLVERTRSAVDGRATDAVLTESGWRALSAAAPKHVAWVRTLFFSGISARQEAQLADVLGIVYENIVAEGTLPPPEPA